MSHPRDPRLRRQQADPLAAAVRLELAADSMRRTFTLPPEEEEPSPEEWAATAATLTEVAPALVTPFEAIAAEHIAAAVQLGTVAPPITAQEFAQALAAAPPPLELVTCADLLRSCTHDGPHVPVGLDAQPVTESAEPAPVVPLPPAPPATVQSSWAPAGQVEPPRQMGKVFSSEQPRVLDWRPRHDPASRRYGIRERLRGATPLQDVLLPSVWPTLDQGAEGACVGFAVAAAWNTVHPLAALDAVAALEIFRAAEKLDEFPGEGLGGSSVLGGMKAAVATGLFGGYLWSFGTRDIRDAILTRRPVVVGVPWLSDMYETGPAGLVRVTGEDTGAGHCLTVVGIRRTGPQGQPGPFFVWHNSWGDDYGDGGLGYIHHRELARLLRGRGEAAIPTAEPQEPTP